MKAFLKSFWMKIQQKGTLYASRNEKFDTLYKVSDPWQMESEREQFRFQKTSNIIEHQLGNIGSLLEIGCGEGHQSQYLSRLCKQLYGFDVSKSAVERAQRRLPSSHFSVADIFSYQPELKTFDVVVACEVLYYVKDVPLAIKKMNELGARCLVTYYQSGPCILDPFFEHIPGIKYEIIRLGNISWKVVWWDTGYCRQEGLAC